MSNPPPSLAQQAFEEWFKTGQYIRSDSNMARQAFLSAWSTAIQTERERTINEIEKRIQAIAILDVAPDGDYERGEAKMADLILKACATLRTGAGDG